MKGGQDFLKPITDSTVHDGRESFPPAGYKVRVVLWRGCLEESLAEGQSTRAHPARRLPGVWLFIAVKR